MAAFGPFEIEYDSVTLLKGRRAPEDQSGSSRSEIPTSSARGGKEAAFQLSGNNTHRQAAPSNRTPKKSLTKPTPRRPADSPASNHNRQQGLPAAEQAAVPTQIQTDHALPLGCLSPVPLPLPTDLNKLPKFKRKSKRVESKLWTQTGKFRERREATESEALQGQEACPRTSHPEQVPSTIPLPPSPASGTALEPWIAPTPIGPRPLETLGRKRSALSLSESGSDAGPQEWHKKQRTGTVGPKARKNATQPPRVASRSKNPAAVGRGLRVPESLPPKPPVSMPTSQHMSAATRVVHATGLTRQRSPVKPSSTNPLASALGSVGYSVAPHQQCTQPRAVPILSSNASVPSTESLYGSGAQHTTFDPPRRNRVHYRQPAPSSPLQGLSLPTPNDVSGSAGPGATRAGNGHHLAGLPSPYSRAPQAHSPHTRGAVPRSLPVAFNAGLHGFSPTGHRQFPPGS